MVQEWNAETKEFESVEWPNEDRVVPIRPMIGLFAGLNEEQKKAALKYGRVKDYPNEGDVYMVGKNFPSDSAFDAGGPPKSKAAEICERAANLIDGDRDVQHGDRRECHSLIAKFWGVYLGKELSPTDVALMMALLKLARTQTGSFDRDHYTDLVGYGALAGELAEGGC